MGAGCEFCHTMSFLLILLSALMPSHIIASVSLFLDLYSTQSTQADITVII